MEDTSKNRSNGYLMIGSNGNSIFLPVVEWRYEDSIVRTGGFYWSLASDRTDDMSYKINRNMEAL